MKTINTILATTIIAASFGGTAVAQAAPTASASAVTTLRYGSSGADVLALQKRLVSLGWMATAPNGNFGPATTSAVKDFQSAAKLTADGVAGPATRAALALTTAPRRGASTTTVARTMSYGMSGADVLAIQKRLVSLGWMTAAPNGNFGPATQRAVAAYQTRMKFTADGVARPAVVASLMAVSAPRNTETSTTYVSDSKNMNSLVEYAKTFTGVKYTWGGNTPQTGMDCSGFTKYVYAGSGMTIPRTAETQRLALKPVTNPRPGDLVFFGVPSTHVGIVVDNGTMMIDAPYTGATIGVHPIKLSRVHSFGRL